MPRTGFSPKRYAEVDAMLESMYTYLEALKLEYDETASTETYWLMSRAAITLHRLRFELQNEQKAQHTSEALQPRSWQDNNHNSSLKGLKRPRD